jgi:hypothetical protein
MAPNRDSEWTPLKNHLVPIEVIEKATGLLFFVLFLIFQDCNYFLVIQDRAK